METKVNTVTVRDVVIGEGIPKICVPIVGRNREDILQEARAIAGSPADLAEFRADHYDDLSDTGCLEAILGEIRAIIGNMPLLMTLRTREEGGCRDISDDDYLEINQRISGSGIVDLIDVEYFRGEEIVRGITESAHAAGVKVIVSSHDFTCTPPAPEITDRMRRMQETGADIVKVAVMPQTRKDVITLLAAADEMMSEHADRPVITISMAGPGVVTRIAGEVFGSAVTFGCASKPSAPGQIGVYELKDALSAVHSALQVHSKK